MKRIAAQYIMVDKDDILKKSIIFLDNNICVEKILPLTHETPSTIFYNGIVFAIEKDKTISIDNIINWQNQNPDKIIFDYLKSISVLPIINGKNINELRVLIDIDFETFLVNQDSYIKSIYV